MIDCFYKKIYSSSFLVGFSGFSRDLKRISIWKQNTSFLIGFSGFSKDLKSVSIWKQDAEIHQWVAI